jgi:hypothetical protein
MSGATETAIRDDQGARSHGRTAKIEAAPASVESGGGCRWRRHRGRDRHHRAQHDPDLGLALAAGPTPKQARNEKYPQGKEPHRGRSRHRGGASRRRTGGATTAVVVWGGDGGRREGGRRRTQEHQLCGAAVGCRRRRRWRGRRRPSGFAEGGGRRGVRGRGPSSCLRKTTRGSVF